jgi:phenylacetate-CoA ligase
LFPLLEKVYLYSPSFIKRVFVNVEAVRRDLYRKFGDYNELLIRAIDKNELVNGLSEDELKEKLQYLLEKAQSNTRYYKDSRYKIHINKLSDLSKLPVLEKSDIRENATLLIANNSNKKDLYEGRTSGSTGTPLDYYVDKNSVRKGKLSYEAFLNLIGCGTNERSARISGVKVLPFNKTTPPFWIYIDLYKQLQCSAFHIKDETVPLYNEAMKRYKVSYGTGYPTAWLFLAQYIDKLHLSPPKIKAIVTDSEGISQDQQRYIEKIFDCPVYQTYGLGEVCCFSVMCKYGHYHIFSDNVYVEIIDEDNKPVEPGMEGEIIVTDLNSERYPIIRYRTGDFGVLGTKKCECGWNTTYLSKVTGRVDDYVITPDGRKIGRLSHIMKPAKGVLESQLVQTRTDELKIKVVPSSDFEVKSMETVISNAQHYLGTDIKISWEPVDVLERTTNGKIRYVIRKI